MRAGKLKHRVKYEQMNNSVDEYGGQITKWITFAERWAEVRTGTVTSGAGHEAVNARKVQPVKTFVLRHRFINNLTEAMRVVYNNKIMEITGILYPDNNNVYMDVIVKELGLNAS
jgi:SPP1 family predicted phage head-tail adaptor